MSALSVDLALEQAGEKARRNAAINGAGGNAADFWSFLEQDPGSS